MQDRQIARPRARFRCALVLLAACMLAGSAPTSAQSDDLRRRIEALDAGQKEILKQLQELKTLIQTRPAVPSGGPMPPNPAALPSEPLSIAGAATRGKSDARLVMLEFSDFQCPFCGRYTRETYDQLKRDYVDTGKVRYVFRHYPLESLHPNAFKAALASECALRQGKFWEMHDRLFANQNALGDADLLAAAKTVGIDGGTFQKCVVQPELTAKVRRDLDDGARAGVTGTPAFFLGVLQKDGRLKVVRKISGAAPAGTFRTALDTLLASPEVSK